MTQTLNLSTLMPLSSRRRLLSACTAGAVMLSCSMAMPVVHAQTTAPGTAAKPAPAKAAPSKPSAAAANASAKSTLGGGDAVKSGERVMTREELRACLNRSDELVSRRQEIERDDASIEQQRRVLADEAEVLKIEQGVLRTDSEQQQAAFKDRADKLTARVKEFRDRTSEDKRGQGRVQSRSELAEIERERVKLDADIKALNADRDALIKDLEQRTADFNAKITDRDGRATAWNDRMRAQRARMNAHESDADTWRRECGNRPYREDDEKAIRAGK